MIQSNIENNIYYRGEVNIKAKRNGKIYNIDFHNTGTNLLTDTIAKALAGQDISEQIPKYLNFTYKNGDKVGVLIRRPVPFTGIVWKPATNNECSCLYLTATIIASDKQATIVTNTTEAFLEMQTLYGQTLATMTHEDLIKFYDILNEGTDLVVEWKMYFNK